MYNSMYWCRETAREAGNTALVCTTVCTGVGKQLECQVTALGCTTACTSVGKQLECQITALGCTTVCTGVGKQPERQVTLHLYVQQHVQVWGNSQSGR